MLMHEGCGLHGASEDEFASALAADGILPSWRLGAFQDLDGTLRDSLARLRSSPELPHRDRIRGFVFDPETGALREVADHPAGGGQLGWAASDACGHLPSPGRRHARGAPPARAAGPHRRGRADRAQRRVRIGPAHLPRARPDRARLHDRPRVRRHGRGGRRSGEERGRRRSRAGLLPDRRRRLLLLPPRPVPPLRELAHLRPRGHARVAAGNPGRDGPDPQRRPRAAARARGHEARGGAVRRRRDGHRLPRDPGKRHAARRRGGGAGTRARGAVRRAGRPRHRRGPRVRDRHRPRATGGRRVLRRPAAARHRAGRESGRQGGDRRPRRGRERGRGRGPPGAGERDPHHAGLRGDPVRRACTPSAPRCTWACCG